VENCILNHLQKIENMTEFFVQNDEICSGCGAEIAKGSMVHIIGDGGEYTSVFCLECG